MVFCEVLGYASLFFSPNELGGVCAVGLWCAVADTDLLLWFSDVD
jgi:hypothetical protein